MTSLCKFCKSPLSKLKQLPYRSYSQCNNCKILQIDKLNVLNKNCDVEILVPSNLHPLNIKYPLPNSIYHSPGSINISNINHNMLFKIINCFPQYTLRIYKNNYDIYRYEYDLKTIWDYPILKIDHINPINFNQKLKTILTFS
jgi:hypothetical protein